MEFGDFIQVSVKEKIVYQRGTEWTVEMVEENNRKLVQLIHNDRQLDMNDAMSEIRALRKMIENLSTRIADLEAKGKRDWSKAPFVLTCETDS